MNVPELPPEEMGVLVAAAVSVLREAVAELVRRSSDADRAAIEAALESLAQKADGLNTDLPPGMAEAYTRHVHNQVRLLLSGIRTPLSGE